MTQTRFSKSNAALANSSWMHSVPERNGDIRPGEFRLAGHFRSIRSFNPLSAFLTSQIKTALLPTEYR
jgi:hypothetical protein